MKADGETIAGTCFVSCIFEKCTFIEAVFERCRFQECTFRLCDLSLARLPNSQLEKTTFQQCRMPGINWCAADWASHALLKRKNVDFLECLLDHNIFIHLDLSETSFRDSRVRQCDFEGAVLVGADFHQSDLNMTRFVQCDLSKANFTGADNYQINAAENTLHKTRFSLPEAVALLHSLDIILED